MKVHRLIPLRHDVITKFRSHVNAGGDDCWLWTGRFNRSGYGVLTIDHRPFLAHRVAYAIEFGNPSQHVLHRCDNPPCVRYDHLFVGSDADNVHDCIAKGRANLRPQGIGIGYARLNFDLADQIRASYIPGVVSQREVGKRFGVSQWTVCLIVNGKTWRTEAS